MKKSIFKQIEEMPSLKKSALWNLGKKRAKALLATPKFHREVDNFRKVFKTTIYKREEHLKSENIRCFDRFERQRFGIGSIRLPYERYSIKKMFKPFSPFGFFEYTKALDEICYRYGLPSSWINYLKACIWFDHPDDKDIPIGVEVRFDFASRLTRYYVKLNGNETNDEIDYAIKEVRLLNNRGFSPRDTLKTDRRQRISSLIMEYPKKSFLQLYHIYNDLFTDDDMSEDAFRKTWQRMKK